MKEIFVSRNSNILRIAIKEDGALVSCLIEEGMDEPFPGQIYKGIVKNIVPAIKCAFVDIGKGKDTFMYLDSKFNNTSIKKGDEIIVEVVKEGLGNKGAKVSNAFTIPGRYAVIETMKKSVEISKKINNAEYIDELLEKIKKPPFVGVMIRTNAEKVAIKEVNDEIEKLYNIYTKVVNDGTYSNKPKLLYDTGGYIGKVLRDFADEDTQKIFLDDKEDYKLVSKYFEEKTDVKIEVGLYNGEIKMFDFFEIEQEIIKLIDNKIQLKSGGSIVIEKTEAMYVIDVNSNKNIKSNSIEKTAKNINVEAAKEIAKQVRLRNLSGIIAIDFIDTSDEYVQNQIIKILNKGFENDKVKTVVYPFTELSIVQIARSRKGKPISEYIEENCYHCKGHGRTLKLSYLASLIENQIIKITEEMEKKESILITLDPFYQEKVNRDINFFIKSIGAENFQVYLDFKNMKDFFKVESLVFENQKIQMLNKKVYG